MLTVTCEKNKILSIGTTSSKNIWNGSKYVYTIFSELFRILKCLPILNNVRQVTLYMWYSGTLPYPCLCIEITPTISFPCLCAKANICSYASGHARTTINSSSPTSDMPSVVARNSPLVNILVNTTPCFLCWLIFFAQPWNSSPLSLAHSLCSLYFP